MNQHMFSVSRNKPTRANARKIERIAKRHKCDFIEYVDPGSGYKNWFAGPNLGHPFRRRDGTRRDVRPSRRGHRKRRRHRCHGEALTAFAGLLCPRGRRSPVGFRGVGRDGRGRALSRKALDDAVANAERLLGPRWHGCED